VDELLLATKIIDIRKEENTVREFFEMLNIRALRSFGKWKGPKIFGKNGK
jgi:hypothetical protein